MGQTVERPIEVRDEDAGVTVSAFVRRLRPELSWSRVRALCARGQVFVNGAVETNAARRLAVGDAVAISDQPMRTKQVGLPREAIVYVDRDVVVVRKPPGLLSVPYEDGDKDTLVDQVRIALRRMERAKGHTKSARYDPGLGVVQRLDKDTSGIMVFARTLSAKRHLQQQFRVHSVERSYVALAYGDVPKRTVESYILPDRGDGLRGSHGVPFRTHRRRLDKGPPPPFAQRAVTHIEPLESLHGATFIRCRLQTGRQHQIRIHLSELGHPLVGEEVYIRDYEGPRVSAPRIMLHAHSLGFTHPRTEKRVQFKDPLPGDFVRVKELLAGPAPATASSLRTKRR